jgi:hypothetical protein
MELDSSFEDDLRNAVLDDVHESLIGTDGLAEEVQTHAHGLLRAYGQRHDYDVESLIDAGTLEVDRLLNPLVNRDAFVVGFELEAFEFGAAERQRNHPWF